jgi:hypothetical protein
VTDAPPPFRPSKLPKASLEAPLEAHWKVMGAEDAKRLHARAQADHARWNPVSPRNRRRFLRVALGTSVAFALLGWFFVAGGLRGFLAFAGFGFLLGAVVALVRPYDYLCGALYGLAAVGAGVVCGARVFVLAPAAAIFYMVGIATGRVEDGKAFDGE